MHRETKSIAARFWPKVDRRGADECWPWLASKDRHGYGHISAGRRGKSPLKAYRVSYELANGPIPEGLHVRHTCDNPHCVNPAHLLVGTAADNVADRMNRGRFNSAVIANLQCSWRRAFSEDEVEQIKTLAAANMSQRQIGRMFNVHASTVALYLKGKR